MSVFFVQTPPLKTYSVFLCSNNSSLTTYSVFLCSNNSLTTYSVCFLCSNNSITTYSAYFLCSNTPFKNLFCLPLSLSSVHLPLPFSPTLFPWETSCSRGSQSCSEELTGGSYCFWKLYISLGINRDFFSIS